jgi:coenzyme Q-binding protein COQ10
MAKVERSILINAPTETIDQIALDASRLPEWYVGVEDTKPDDLYPEVDGRVLLVYKAAGVTFNLALTVQELVRGDHISYQMTGMMIGTQEWGYTPEGSRTRLTALVEYEMPGGALGKIADKLVVERMNAKNLEQSLENLKALVEG